MQNCPFFHSPCVATEMELRSPAFAKNLEEYDAEFDHIYSHAAAADRDTKEITATSDVADSRNRMEVKIAG